MLRILLVGCALLLLSSAPNRPGPEKTFIRLLKKDQIQELFAGQNEIIVYSRNRRDPPTPRTVP